MKISITIPEQQIGVTQPADFVPEDKKDKDWFMGMVRYYATFYNQYGYGFDTAQQTTSASSPSQPASLTYRIADDMVNNFSYLFGKQPNINYRFLEVDSTGNYYPNPWIRGRKAAAIVDFANGDMLRQLDSVSFDALSLSKDVALEKMKLFDRVELVHEVQYHPAMQQLAEMGIELNPYPKKFEDKEDIEEEKKTYRDQLEDDAIAIAEDIYTRNNCKYIYSKFYLHTLCGLGAIYNYVSNGKLMKKMIPCYNAIWDNRQDNDFGTDMKFWGFVEYNTPSGWVAQAPDLADIGGAVDELIAIGGNNVENITQFYSYYNAPFNNLQWWTINGNANLVAGIRMFWVAPKNLKFKKYVNDYGQQRIKTMKQDEPYRDEDTEYITNTVYTALVVGNRWVTQFGEAKNILRDPNNKGNPVPNMTFFIPNMTMGMPKPMMSMIKASQNELDRLSHKVREITSRDYGRVPIINASLMGESGKDAIAFSDELKNIGMLVARNTGEYNALIKATDAIAVVDLSSNANLISYLELKREEERMMEEYVGYSKIALGQQRDYVSRDVQQATMTTSSNVMNYTIEGLFESIRRDMQYSINVQKMHMDKEELVVSDRGMKIIKGLGKRRFEDVMVNLKIQDYIDDATRARIVQYAVNWSMNPQMSGIDPADILMMEQEKSLSQMIRKLQASMRKKKNEAQKQQAYQDTLAMIQQQKDLETQGAIAEQQNQTKKEVATQNNNRSFGEALLAHNVGTEQVGAQREAAQATTGTE
jgi:hypothetical protein